MNWKNYVNLIAIIALLEYPDHIKEHPTWGWKIGVLYPGDERVHYDYNTYYHSYCFADAVTTAAKISSMNSHLGFVNAWVEPSEDVSRDEEEEYCVWIIHNNLDKEDYTTIENVSRGAQNLPFGGIWTTKYDKEYKNYVETYN